MGLAGTDSASAGSGASPTGGGSNGGAGGHGGTPMMTGGTSGSVGNAGSAGRAGGAGHAGNAGSSGSGGAAGLAGNGGSAGKGGSGGNGGSAGKGGSSASGGNGGSAGKGGSSGSGGNGGSAGKGGTGGTGGTAGTGGVGDTGGAGGGGGTGGVGGTGGKGGALCLDNSACSDREYCAKLSCVANAEGQCTPRPSACSNTKQATVCGCDGVTYHDSCLLHLNRQNSSAAAECSKTADATLGCSSIDETACTAKGGICAYKAELGCDVVPTVSKGVCWILPASCPGSDDQTARSCNADQASCISECAVIKNRQSYTLPNACN